MKSKILRTLVLLVSISAASVLIWNATRDQKMKQAEEEEKISPKKMQGSSKMAVIVTADIIENISTEDNYIVEDKVPNGDTLLFSPKWGAVDSKTWLDMISDVKINAGLNSELEGSLMHSSKSFIGPVFEPKELKEIIEGENQEANEIQNP
jgi:hypothetical protein